MSNKSLKVDLENFIAAGKEKTYLKLIEPFLPALVTLVVLIFSKNSEKANFQDLKTELVEMVNQLNEEQKEQIKKEFDQAFGRSTE